MNSESHYVLQITQFNMSYGWK